MVEEILEIGRRRPDHAFVRSIHHPAARRYRGYSPDLISVRNGAARTLEIVESLSLALRFSRPWRVRVRKDSRRRGVGTQKAAARVFFSASRWTRSGRSSARDESVAEDYRKRTAAAGMPEWCSSRPNESWRGSNGWAIERRSSMIRTYLDWLLAVPWSTRSKSASTRSTRGTCSTPTMQSRRRQGTHHEYLAVRKLRAERGLTDDRGRARFSTDRTPERANSIGESIARDTAEVVRMSLGGVRDESEIRGHRRTYIGALPATPRCAPCAMPGR